MQKLVQIYEINKKSKTVPKSCKALDFFVLNSDMYHVLDADTNPHELVYKTERRPVYRVVVEDAYDKKEQYLCISEELFFQFEIITKSEKYVSQLSKALNQVEELKKVKNKYKKLLKLVEDFNYKPWYKRVWFVLKNKF